MLDYLSLPVWYELKPEHLEMLVALLHQFMSPTPAVRPEILNGLGNRYSDQI